MAKICNGNHNGKNYYHEHRCECPCECKKDALGYAFCMSCSFESSCGRLRIAGKRALHALSFYERQYGRGQKCVHNPKRIIGTLCLDCNQEV